MFLLLLLSGGPPERHDEAAMMEGASFRRTSAVVCWVRDVNLALGRHVVDDVTLDGVGVEPVHTICNSGVQGNIGLIGAGCVQFFPRVVGSTMII